MDGKASQFVSNNWTVIGGVLTAVFIAGGIVSEFRLMRAEIDELKKDVNTRIQQLVDERERKNNWLEEQEERIDELEEWRSWEDGRHNRDKK